MSTNTGPTDRVLQFINKQFVTLQDEDKKLYMQHYQRVLEHMVLLMKEEDKLFNAIYSRLFWAGSYYDGLKVGQPREYDVDVVMRLPVHYDAIQIVNDDVTPPFTKINVKDIKTLINHPRWSEYRRMEKWIDVDGYLLQSEFRKWMESVIAKALRKSRSGWMVINNESYLIKFRKTGPAMTFNITIPGGTTLDVDFVPVIEFDKRWPPEPIRKNHTSRGAWCIVPKPNSKFSSQFEDTYWRLAFHEQEREMINGKEHLKPICRLLKKFRDNDTAFKCICSYYIKTMFLWEIMEQEQNPTYWSSGGLTCQFMTMLKKLHENIKNKNVGIRYFWDERYDFLTGMSDAERSNIENRLGRIIKEIERVHSEDPTIFAKHLLNEEELAKFRKSYFVNGAVDVLLTSIKEAILPEPTEYNHGAVDAVLTIIKEAILPEPMEYNKPKPADNSCSVM